MNNTIILSHPACLEHRPGPHHPESPERLETVLNALRSPEFASLEWRDAPLGTIEQAQLIHDPAFVDEIAEMAPNHGYVPLDGGDTVMNGHARNAFCAARPCGHHAEPAKAMGFCIFNQAAIAAAYALETFQLERVAVVDFDVHHGNGTQAAFFNRPELFYASSHQSPLYPGPGPPP